MNRFEMPLDGEALAVSYCKIEDGRVVLLHTEVPQELSGQGLASRLAHGVFEALRRDGRRAVAKCPFMSSYRRVIRRHPRSSTGDGDGSRGAEANRVVVTCGGGHSASRRGARHRIGTTRRFPACAPLLRHASPIHATCKSTDIRHLLLPRPVSGQVYLIVVGAART